MTLFDAPAPGIPAQVLRSYQESAVQAVEAARDRGLQRVVLVLPTGCGKTTVFSALAGMWDAPTLILAHRDELLTQARDRISQNNPRLAVEIEGGPRTAQPGADVVVAGVQSISRPSTSRLKWFKPRRMVVDECFPAGTLIDGRPIESVQKGDFVDCFDHGSGVIVRRRVVRVMRRRTGSSVVQIELGNGATIRCTPEHPFWNGREYVLARTLEAGDICYESREVHQAVEVPRVWARVHAQESIGERLSTNLLGRVSRKAARRKAQACDSVLRSMRFGSGLRGERPAEELGERQQGQGLLLRVLSRRLRFRPGVSQHDRNEPEVRFRTDAGPKPDVARGCSCEGIGDSEGHRAPTEDARRERDAHGASKGARGSAGMAMRGGSLVPTARRSADGVQGRRREPGLEDRDRGGWAEPQRSEGEGSGPAQGGVLAVLRVERVSVLEPGSDGTFGGLCPNGLVYNLEVEEHHNYFANGVLVHNCHHSTAPSYQNVFERFGSYRGECFTLGVTATDHRMDNKPLHGRDGAIFEEVVFRYTLREAIGDGWLCDLRGYRVRTDVDLSGVRTTAGDYNQGQLADAVNIDARNEAAFKHWYETAGERRTIVFCVDVQHARDVAQLFREKGVAAAHVDGSMRPEDRQRIMGAFRTGQTQVLTNCELVTEGVDVPEIGCVLMLRPTKSWALFTQMVGRGLRISEGKVDCVVIDVVDNTASHRLGDRPAVAGLVGLPAQLDLEGQTLQDALSLFEELGGMAQARLFQRDAASFNDLRTGIKEVDLLAELSVPEEISGATRHAWLKIGEGRYVLNCGSSREEGGPKNREASIEVDELGSARIRLRSDRGTEPLVHEHDLRRAFSTADSAVRLLWPDCAGIVARKAQWRERPPSEGQMRFLRRLRVPSATLEAVRTMGEASALIEKCKAGGRV